MPAGRPPKPTASHKLQGTYRADRHKDRGDNGDTFGGTPKKPATLRGEEAKVWARLIQCLPVGILSSVDEMQLEACCRWWVRYDQLMRLSAKHAHDLDVAEKIEKRAMNAWKICDRTLSRFGMTPADRVRLKAPGDDSAPVSKLSKLGIVG